MFKTYILKFLTALFSFLAIMTITLTGVAYAQTVPPGSYQKTCYGFAVNGDTLSATCKKMKGGYTGTSLKAYSQCKGDIGNLDGNLTCPKDMAVPSGSYQKTCYGISVSGGTLSATCRTKKGAFTATSLAGFKTCSSDIGNKDGQLVCAQGGSYQPPSKQQYSVCVVNLATGSRYMTSSYGYSAQDAASNLFNELTKSNYGGVGFTVYPNAC